MEALPTLNPDHGFWGQIAKHRGSPARAWGAASAWLIADAGLTAAQARTVLDSHYGRHLADRLMEDNALGAPRLADVAVRHGYRSWAQEIKRTATTKKTLPA